MKKVLALTVLAMFLMVPVSFAKTMISESDLAAVTAQEGVTITFDNLTITNVTIDEQSWGDADGFDSYSDAGWVGASISTTGDLVALSGSLTIDVGTSGAVTAVRIGLPSLTIGSDTMSVTQVVKLSTAKELTGTQVLGTSYMGGLEATVSGGLIITAH
ncbi:MAG: DUF6160 family protein [Smithella sp.]|jgi:hypothetical protein